MSEIERFPSLKGMATVNEAVNQGSYIEDMTQYGLPDHWSGKVMETGGSGDCEDYAIAKANRLEALGWARGELCLAIVCSEKSPGPDHGILAVIAPFRRRAHDEERLFLDNRFPGILTLSDLSIKGYRPFIIQTGGTLEWREWTWEAV